MRISPEEQHAINETVLFGQRFGYGNLISHLQTAWARKMMDEHNIGEESAKRCVRVSICRRWDEAGENYLSPPKKKN